MIADASADKMGNLAALLTHGVMSDTIVETPRSLARRQHQAREHMSAATAPATPQLPGKYNLTFLQAWRLVAGIGQNNLSDRAHLGRLIVPGVEAQRRRAAGKTVQRLADTLGLPPEILLAYAPTDVEAQDYAADLAYRFALERLERAGISFPPYAERE